MAKFKLKAGQTFRILSCGTSPLAPEYNDWYGMPVGSEFTITEVDDDGFGWCKPHPKMSSFWNSPNIGIKTICIVSAEDVALGQVELVK